MKNLQYYKFLPLDRIRNILYYKIHNNNFIQWVYKISKFLALLIIHDMPFLIFFSLSIIHTNTLNIFPIYTFGPPILPTNLISTHQFHNNKKKNPTFFLFLFLFFLIIVVLSFFEIEIFSHELWTKHGLKPKSIKKWSFIWPIIIIIIINPFKPGWATCFFLQLL